MLNPVQEFDRETIAELCDRVRSVADWKKKAAASTGSSPDAKEHAQSMLACVQRDLAIFSPKRKVIKALRFHANPLIAANVSLTFVRVTTDHQRVVDAPDGLDYLLPAISRSRLCYGFVFALPMGRTANNNTDGGPIEHMPVTCPFADEVEQLKDALRMVVSDGFERACSEIFTRLFFRAFATRSRPAVSILHKFVNGGDSC